MTAAMDWRTMASCREVTVSFFPGSSRDERQQAREAMSTCMRCPVRLACLQWAVEHKEYYGIWGGTTEAERRRMIEGAEA